MVRFDSGAAVEFGHHGAAQNRVHAGQPGKHIGIQSRRDLLVDRAIEPAPDSAGPLRVSQPGSVLRVYSLVSSNWLRP